MLSRVVDQVLGARPKLWPLHQIFYSIEMEMSTEVEVVVGLVSGLIDIGDDIFKIPYHYQ